MSPRRTAALAIALVALGTAAGAQAPLPGEEPLGQRNPPLKPRVTATITTRAVYGMPAFRESSVEITATGTAGFSLSIRSLPNITMPGNQPLSSLIQLVDAPGTAATAPQTPPATNAPSMGGPGGIAGPVQDPRRSRIPDDVLTSRQDPAISTPVTIRKLLVFRGIDRRAVSNPERFLRTFEMEVQATRTGTAAITRRFVVVLSNDDGPPAIVSIGAEASAASNSGSADDFPPVVRPTGQEAQLYATKTYKLNWVQLHRRVTVIASDFSVDGERPSADFKRYYKLVTEYQDGARYVYPYQNLGAYPAATGALRLQFHVPNIRRGNFRVYLESPFGRSAPSQFFSFPSNQFVTTLPVATGPVVAVNVDSPLNVGGFETLLGMAIGTYQYTVLPPQPQCPDGFPVPYGLWERVAMGPVEVFPVGVASAKFTRVPATGSFAHSGNMPAITGTSAGLGTIYAHWEARLRIYESECPQDRLVE